LIKAVAIKRPRTGPHLEQASRVFVLDLGPTAGSSIVVLLLLQAAGARTEVVAGSFPRGTATIAVVGGSKECAR